MKISRLGVTLGLAAMVAGAVSSNAQVSSNSASVGVSADFVGAPIIDVFGAPTFANTDLVDFTAADTSVFTDGGGKISGFVTGTLTPATGTAADLVATVTGSISSKGTTPVLKMTLKGNGAPSDGSAGSASFKFTFTSTGSAAPITTITTNITIIGTNTIDLSNTNTFTIDCDITGTNCTTNATLITSTNTVTNTTAAAFSGTVSGTYKSGVKGEPTVKLKNVAAEVLDIDSTDLNVSIGVVGNGKKLFSAGRITPGLPVTGNGSNSKSKFSIKLKGTGVGKGSSLTLSGASATDTETGDVNISAVKASGKVLGQKVDKTADDADVTVTPGLPTGGGL